MTTLIPVIVGAAGLILGSVLTYVIAFSGARSKAKRILDEAEAQGEVMKKNKLLEVKEKFLNKKAELEKRLQHAAKSSNKQRAASSNARFNSTNKKAKTGRIMPTIIVILRLF